LFHIIQKEQKYICYKPYYDISLIATLVTYYKTKSLEADYYEQGKRGVVLLSAALERRGEEKRERCGKHAPTACG